MATYKVIQDIEAEDHILGPLTLRQFIYALVAVFCFYLCFLSVAKLHAPFLLILFLPPALFCGFFAVPFGKDQSTEVWALAKLRFLFKPRKRIWNQSGVKELVTITVPKKIETALTDGLSQGEVKSRLEALASTLDSRGWAVKGVGASAYMQPAVVAAQGGISSDRLLDIGSIPQAVPEDNLRDNDILDENTSAVSQQFTEMITRSEQQHRQELINIMNTGTPAHQAAAPTGNAGQPPADYWFMNDQPDRSEAQAGLPAAAPAPSAPDDAVLAAQLRAREQASDVSYAHMRTLKPLGEQASPAPQAPPQPAAAPRPSPRPQQPLPTPTVAADQAPVQAKRASRSEAAPAGAKKTPPAILPTAKNDDAKAGKSPSGSRTDEPPEDEVVISLH